MLLTSSDFSSKNTPKLAKDLLGKILVRHLKDKEIKAVIVETEAYHGFFDLASHASRGKTPRNTPIFFASGHWYVYFIYGNHFMLNLVTGPENYPAAVLIRGVLLLSENKRIDGPGRLTKILKIDKKFNSLPIGKKSGLWIENSGVKISRKEIECLPRVGVNYAGPVWSKKLWRFRLK